MNVVPVMKEILNIANAVISETSLPDFPGSANHSSEGVRISAFDQLDRMFERDIVCWCQ
jgi:hypothetical protein